MKERNRRGREKRRKKVGMRQRYNKTRKKKERCLAEDVISIGW
jgi:hypothetical protein